MKTFLAVVALLSAGLTGTFAKEDEPAEYEEDEFTPWMLKLRRGEIILFGSMPFSVFFASLGYDVYRYAVHFSEDTRSAYAPWPFRGANSIPYTVNESAGVMIGALAASVLFALGDFVLGEISAKRSQAP